MRSINELDPEIQKIILLSDAYGAEGELGIVLSEKFMEHDAYCMFDALMSGVNGSVAMADFFAHSPACGSKAALPPVIEASAALYHLLSTVDSSLHSHLVELGLNRNTSHFVGYVFYLVVSSHSKTFWQSGMRFLHKTIEKWT